jgi:hypothetical protein
MQGAHVSRVAGVQCRICPDVAGCDVVQYDDVGGNFLIAEGRFLDDGRLDQLDARLDLLNQGLKVGYDSAIIVISTA